VLALHHLRKSPGDAFERIRGSSALGGAANIVTVLTHAEAGRRIHVRSHFQGAPENLDYSLYDLLD